MFLCHYFTYRVVFPFFIHCSRHCVVLIFICYTYFIPNYLYYYYWFIISSSTDLVTFLYLHYNKMDSYSCQRHSSTKADSTQHHLWIHCQGLLSNRDGWADVRSCDPTRCCLMLCDIRPSCLRTRERERGRGARPWARPGSEARERRCNAASRTAIEGDMKWRWDSPRGGTKGSLCPLNPFTPLICTALPARRRWLGNKQDQTVVLIPPPNKY